MDGFLIGGVILVVVLVLWLALQSLQSRQKDGAIESQMNELRRDLQTIATSQAQSTGKLETIAKSVAQRLDSVAPALQDAIRNSAQITGQMTSDAQTKMADELKNTRDQISQIQRQLGEVQLAGKQMSQTAQTLEGILGGDRKSTRLNSSHSEISYAVFCLKNKDLALGHLEGDVVEGGALAVELGQVLDSDHSTAPESYSKVEMKAPSELSLSRTSPNFGMA